MGAKWECHCPPIPSHYLPFLRPDALNTSTLVQKLRNYCNALRDDGMGCGHYVEQLTYLLVGSGRRLAP